MTIPVQTFDAVIVGAGGAGLRASYQLAAKGDRVAVISKVFPTRSHTVSAQGGINAALAAGDEDDWRWHMFDTIKGSDYLGDQDSIEYMCSQAAQSVYELEHMGMPFSRLDSGRIYQRRFGGQSKNFGGEQAARTCAVADRTGHALLHTLYQQNLKAKTTFFSEWYALDLVKTGDDAVSGVLALCIATGEIVLFQARAVVLATGGAGQIHTSTTNAAINTGDGLGMALRAGFPLQDMEMWQFHPTGIAGAGVLVTEGCRGEGGYLVNKNGERFMERYAPKAKDLASRDVVSRSMTIEIREGRGCGPNGDYVLLKLDHLGEELISKRLPGIRELAKTFAHVDPVKDPIPVVPTSHYMMGGIPTNYHGQVISVKDGKDFIVQGLYAVGECACVSVHGANRLGGNSLLDLVVFGRAAGLHIAEEISGDELPFLTPDEASVEKAMARVTRWNTQTEGESVANVRRDLKKIMQNDFGVFRQEDSMQQGSNALIKIRERLQHCALSDTSLVFNTARIEALELENLMEVAEATAACALLRTESRGAHSRMDYPDRDDKNWIKHLVYFSGNKVISRPVNFAPKTMKAFEPIERVY
ncbi:MAG: succinate dehydrogenase flavoprotein subunit [Legionellales bacterium]|jgi:succinate dehydrogenase / fumarate reductase flavoprotein subunit